MCVGGLSLLVFLWSQDQYMYYDIKYETERRKTQSFSPENRKGELSFV